jgi:hypothetical protein
MMITVFDLKRWHTLEHNPDQMAMFKDVAFDPIQGHPNLYVADVTEEETAILALMGVDIEHTIAGDLAHLGNRSRMLYESKDSYVIIEIHRAIIPLDK